MHRMRRGCSAPDELVCDIGNEYPNFQCAPPQGQCLENFLQDEEDFLGYRLQRETLVRLSFGPSGCDVGPGDSDVRFSVDGHEAWFVTDPALCDQASVCPFRDDSASWWGLMCMTALPLFRWHPLISRRLAIPPVRLSVVSRFSFRPSCRFPCVSQRSFISFPMPVVVFCLPPVGYQLTQSGLAPLNSSTLSLVSSPGWGQLAPPDCHGSRFLGPGC
jgi:hypothetical protein